MNSIKIFMTLVFGPGGGLNTNLTFQQGNEVRWGVKDQQIDKYETGT